jgi:hypothetical protein
VHATDKKQLSPFAHFRYAGAKAASCFLPQMQALYAKSVKKKGSSLALFGKEL